jgi:hypothetical protein
MLNFVQRQHPLRCLLCLQNTFKNQNLSNMKKILLVLFILNFQIAKIQAQKSTFPEGVYLSNEQLKNKTPAYNVNIEVLERSSGDIAMVGGNQYKLESSIDSLSKKVLKNNVYAYVKDSVLYLNCLQFRLQWWYAKGLTNGRYILFRSAMPAGKANNYNMFGAVGGLIASSQKYLNILDVSTGKVGLVSERILTEIVSERKDIEEMFKQETEEAKNLEVIVLKYINLMNN